MITIRQYCDKESVYDGVWGDGPSSDSERFNIAKLLKTNSIAQSSTFFYVMHKMINNGYRLAHLRIDTDVYTEAIIAFLNDNKDTKLTITISLDRLIKITYSPMVIGYSVEGKPCAKGSLLGGITHPNRIIDIAKQYL